jgi:hypothetical protein
MLPLLLLLPPPLSLLLLPLLQLQLQLQTSLTKHVSLPGMMTAIIEIEVSKEDKMRMKYLLTMPSLLLLLLLLQTTLTKDVSLPGMMTAITEIEVSKEDKMRKIEETERIKDAMLLKKTGRWVGAGSRQSALGLCCGSADRQCVCSSARVGGLE